MRFDAPLDDIFLNRSHVRVLRALHRLPAGFAASGREVARRAGVAPPTALKALALLATVGIVAVDRSVAGDSYVMNREHLLTGLIANSFQQEAAVGAELASFLQQKLRSLTDKVKSATLFGSAVWGQSTPGSDIDIAICCDPRDMEEIEGALQELSDGVRRRFGNNLSPLVDSGKSKRRARIWTRIEREGIPLIRAGRVVTS